jgi:hypothetical protein
MCDTLKCATIKHLHSSIGDWALDKEDKEHGGWGDKKQELIMVLSPCPLVSPAPCFFSFVPSAEIALLTEF